MDPKSTLEGAAKSRKGQKRKRDFESVVEETEKEIDWLALAPRCINIVEFAEARAIEINTMMKYVTSTVGGRQVFQTLPRHMRRRAMSHNVKRLPRRLRKNAQFEARKHKRAAKDGTAGKKSRRHRRRPKNLLSEYERRKRKHVWLETHIWHAKRFHMAEKWGYKIPNHPNDKSVRAAYRALAKHCLLQDISYYGVIELTGPQGKLLTSLSHLTNSEIGLTFASASYLTGARHGTILLYKSDQYPHGCMGPVNVLWKPAQPSSANESAAKEEKFDSAEMRQLWIWVHPSSYEEVLSEINAACGAVPVRKKTKKQKRLKTGDKGAEGQTETNQVDDGSESAVLARRSFKNKDAGIRINALKHDLLRFRLQGPLSHSVLHDVLKYANVDSLSPGDSDNTDDQQPKWWETFYESQQNREVHEEQGKMLKVLSDVRRADELPSNCVMSFTVKDPRLLLPPRSKKVMTAAENASDPSPQNRVALSMKLPKCASSSPIWETKIRRRVSYDKLSVDEINTRRSELLVPATELPCGRDDSVIPVLLLHNPGCQQNDQENKASQYTQNCLGLGSGWDIVLPSGWGMAFWIALVYRGARAGGERESQSASQQQALPHFPYVYPDTQAYARASLERKKQLEDKYIRYPPDKRPNFTKLGTATPHHCPWEKVINDWIECDMGDPNGEVSDTGSSSELKTVQQTKDTDSSFFVVRSKTKLKTLANLCQARKNKNQDDALKSQSLSHVIQHCRSALVCVKLRMVQRGVATAFAMVCMPATQDMLELEKNREYGGPQEPPHGDPQHALKKLEKKCKRKKCESELEKRVKKKLQSHIEASRDSDDKVRYSNSREIFGYVCEGSHTFSAGAGCALGYCTLTGLAHLLSKKQTNKPATVLVRNTNSDQYRFAYLNVVTNFW
ncbi:ribonucleases P/MRP protein subunit POP1-like [Ptychodera flava]|uniref:ribonucleases P/MRP protein subunit POP1-like n=1 Tax=Ptychodera flava TaxID=63121 RepID=UPI00396A376E